MKRAVLALITAASLSGCGKNVLYSDISRGPRPESGVITLQYDRYGNLYPSSEVRVPAAALRRNQLQLGAFFERERAARSRDWDALVEDAGLAPIDPSVPFDRAWAAVQTGLRNHVVAQINRYTTGAGAPHPLVVLVHGFNNTMAEAHDWFVVARDSIRRRQPDAVFLYVYWDGLSAALPTGIWPRAQYNFPLVGLEFRRVLNSVDPSVPVRILTHSSGGPLIASTLGDASAPLPSQDSVYRRYRTLVALDTGEYRPPHPVSLRVGMIVPAAATNTFRKYDAQHPGPERLILGLNPRDMATGKVFLRCTALGASCLTTDLRAFCTTVRQQFEGTGTQLIAFDFSNSSNNRRFLHFWDDHSMLWYLRRDDISRFLDLFVGGDDVTDTGEAPEFCRRYGASNASAP